MADPFREPETSGLAFPVTASKPPTSTRSSKRAKLSETSEITLALQPKRTVGELCAIRNTGKPKREKDVEP